MGGADGIHTSKGKKALGCKRRVVVTMFVLAIVMCALIYALISLFQHWDSATIKIAKDLNAFIIHYCEINDRLPTSATLSSRFPALNRNTSWFFYTDEKTFLIVQYPVRWSNEHAIGRRKASEFTATVYAYTVEYRCKKSQSPAYSHPINPPDAAR